MIVSNITVQAAAQRSPRAMMVRRTAAAIVIAGMLAPSLVRAQWIEDSLGLAYVQAICYNSQENKVYFGMDSAVVVLDGATHVVLDTVPVSGAISMLYDPAGNRLFVLGDSGSSLTIVDGSSDSVLATVTLPFANCHDLCFNPLDNRLYCACYGSNAVVVVDVAAGQVVDTLPVSGPGAICYNPTDNLVYCASTWQSESVFVFAGSNDSVVARLAVGSWPYDLCYNSVDNKVYCANDQSLELTVISGEPPQVLKRIPVRPNGRALVHNAADNKVYCSHNYITSGPLEVVDCAHDSVVRTLILGRFAGGLLWNSVNDKVYALTSMGLCDSIIIIGGESDSVLGVIELPLGFWGELVTAWNPVQNRTYVAGGSSRVVCVVRDSMAAIKDESSEASPRPALRVAPSPCRGLLNISWFRSGDQLGGVGYSATLGMFNAVGQRVADLGLGSNDVSQVSSGAYFILEPTFGAVARIVVSRR